MEPIRNCPSPPRLNTPHLYAKQAQRAVKIRGVALVSVVPMPALEPNAPWNRNFTARNGFAPRAAMMIPPIRNASRTDSSGTRNAPNAFFTFPIPLPLTYRSSQG